MSVQVQAGWGLEVGEGLEKVSWASGVGVEEPELGVKVAATEPDGAAHGQRLQAWWQ